MSSNKLLEENTEQNVLEKKEPINTENLRIINIIKTFLMQSILNNNYKPNSLFGEAICLSPLGEKVIKELFNEEIEKSGVKTEMKLAALVGSIQTIDINNTDIDKLLKSAHEEIKRERLLFPYIFGRELYDKFYDLYNQLDRLNYKETITLLKGSQNGVFQVDNLISGPFGLLISQENRNFMPLRPVPVHHCSDSSCQVLHITELSTIVSNISTYERKIREHLRNHPETNTIPKVSRLRATNQFDDNNLDELIVLLGTFALEELQVLLGYLIDNFRNLRTYFPTDNEFRRYWQGNGEKISSKLQHAECLQLIFLCKDLDIVESLEKLIYENKIHIPATEIRRPHFRRNFKRSFKITTECSKFGIRCVVKNGYTEINTALIRLKNLITMLYTDSNNLERLNWKLRNIHGDNFEEKIEKYLLSEDPKRILMNLIFDNPDYVLKTFKYLKYGDFEFPYSPLKEDFVINKILWKLGFNSMNFPEYLSVFWKRHNQFQKTIKVNDIVSEEDREVIRSAGVNYFVSLEEILDYSLSFITWSLLSDHYLDTNFVFNLDSARTFMVESINSYEYSISDSDFLVLDGEGKNTLYPLIKGFTVLAELCEKYLAEKENYKRPLSEYPYYHMKTDIYKFPFEYKITMLNINESEIKKLIDFLRDVTVILETNNISNVRNRIKHNRPINEFPTSEELMNTCEVINQLIKGMENSGIMPQLYIYSGTEIDQYGRGEAKFKNYRDVPIQINNNSQFNRCGLPEYNVPQIIIPNIHIRNSIDKLRFHYQEKSLYSIFWENYPKHKIRYEEENY
ncbi:hypothetical protein CEQ21_24300 [Niallia circulans]|uniref:Uncharacterized protein n=1 Tax=Niallia circulans TaxID=1397 RepID=A0A553SNE3_NIACI|nr:hypothetical protein [Niallia circulans]TRZ38511.1 hypothetical protein CEQ21_24300 [Niallia circulans]